MRLKGDVLDEWPVFTTLVDADKVINVPVAKHHNLAKYTAAMKNWYGVLGGRRNRLHQNIDVSIADLATFMRPTLVVVDAWRVLMRNGPQGGNIDDARDMHTVIATVDQVAADAYGCTLIGQKPREPAVPRDGGEARPGDDALGEPPGAGGLTRMAAPSTPQHAGVRLDPSLAAAHTHAAHEDVEPIPWKTGKVGIVGGIDAITWAPSTPRPLDAACVPTPAHAPTLASAPAPTLAHAPALASVPALASALAPTQAARPAPAKAKKKLPGSGIPPRRIAVVLKWARRFSQVGFFALFMYFLFQTAFRGSFAARADAPVRLPLPVEGFLLADPFVARDDRALDAHRLPRACSGASACSALTMVFGRVFCGWICPFGTLHHFFAWLLPSKQGRGASRVEANKTHTYQRAKYYLLYAFLVAGVAGSAIGGLFDPICIAVRSIGLGVIPGRAVPLAPRRSAPRRTCTRARCRARPITRRTASRRPSGRASSSTSTRPGSSSFCSSPSSSRTASSRASGAACSARSARSSASSRASRSSG